MSVLIVMWLVALALALTTLTEDLHSLYLKEQEEQKEEE